MSKKPRPRISRDEVIRLWLDRQRLADPRGAAKLTRRSLGQFLERVGALQLDSVNVLDRAHYLTLWSRFGAFDRDRVDGWMYGGLAYEYWGHEASLLPISHLPTGLRRMRRFPPESVRRSLWWSRYETPTASKRRVLRRLRAEGRLESTDFERAPDEIERAGPGWSATMPKEDKRSLQLLWHRGDVAIAGRRHFRRVFDIAERVYPSVDPVTTAAYEDSWLHVGLRGNGVASEAHLVNYMTAPRLKAERRRRVIGRNLKRGAIVEVEVEGLRGPHYALPDALADLADVAEPRGTTLVCPFDSLLWQRRRAEELLDFRYRVEIYVPPKKREFGYYVLPILHDGRLVGRLDPKLHRDRGVLEIKSIHLEPGITRSRRLAEGLRGALESLAEFSSAAKITLPRNARRWLAD